MASKVYQLYCDFCGFKKWFSKEAELRDLVEIKQSSIPTGVPRRGDTGKVETPPDKKQKRKFRCPNCGRAIALKKVPEQLLPKETVVEKPEEYIDLLPPEETDAEDKD